MSDWLTIKRGDAPLIVSVPHAGTDIPAALLPCFRSPELARSDADWHVDHLYAFAAARGVTIIRTAVSRAVIDVNRDPSGASLYPGQATTGLCPATAFDGASLYRPGCEPDPAEVLHRRRDFFEPYHAALAVEIARLRAANPAVVILDAHSIRSRVPRLFDGELPLFNIGTNGGTSCSPALTARIEAVCRQAGNSWVTDGRFRGGWITRHHGHPASGVHAIQLELAMRGYLDEQGDWPPAWDAALAAPLQARLGDLVDTCIDFAKGTA
jgi:N-formylglutamate deformylase